MTDAEGMSPDSEERRRSSDYDQGLRDGFKLRGKFEDNDNESYVKGWQEGRELGVNQGWYGAGYDVGWDAGFDAGWDKGFDSGWSAGWDRGWDAHAEEEGEGDEAEDD